jgi:hypothetical protein
MDKISTLLSDSALNSRVNDIWSELSEDFEQAYLQMPVKFMSRPELSFHPYVKLLGYLCIDLGPLEGDIVEIGVWKGKSLALMRRLAQAPSRVIGIDPCELQGQAEELSYFHNALFPDCILIRGHSQLAVGALLGLTSKIKLLHIDGGHLAFNVWMDFLIYDHFVVPGGYVVFDDYADAKFSPEVGPTIDRMNELGVFKNYHVIGSVPSYENSYLLLKK